MLIIIIITIIVVIWSFSLTQVVVSQAKVPTTQEEPDLLNPVPVCHYSSTYSPTLLPTYMAAYPYI